MSIIYKIFEDYLERNFRVTPDLSEERKRGKKMSKLEESFALSKEQKEEFEQFMFETCCDYQQSAFFDGFKVAVDLMFEVGCGLS